MAWNCSVYLHAHLTAEAGAERTFGDDGYISEKREGSLDEVLDLLADVAEDAVRSWGSADWRVALQVELEFPDDLVPGNPALKLRSPTGAFVYHSAGPSRRSVADTVLALEAVSQAAERLFGPPDKA